MTDSMKFGPEWLRNLSQDGCTQPSITTAPRCQLAEHRYGREEMLALFDQLVKAPDLLSSIPSLYVEKTQEPLALQQMTEEETRMWNRGINSDAVLRMTGKAPGIPGALRGRGGSIDRGRGRGRGGFHYSRGLSYEEPGDSALRDRGEGALSSASSFPRNIRPFDRSQSSLTERSWGERNGADMGDWNGSTSPRKEFGGGRGFMNDNWRRHRGGGEDEDGWRTATNSRSDKWIRSSSWREGDKDGNEGERGGVGGRGQTWERNRNWDEPSATTASSHHPHRRPWDEDNLPEWANDIPSESGGSFDASGAFHGGGGYSDEEEDGVTNTGCGNHLRESNSKLLNDSSQSKQVLPGSTVSGRNLSRSTGNESNPPDREREVGKNNAVEKSASELQQQSSDRPSSSVNRLPDSSQTSKLPPKSSSTITDISARSSSEKKTMNDLSVNSKKASASCDTLSKAHHQSSATTNLGKPDSTTNSIFAGSSAERVNTVMGNCNKDMLKAGLPVDSSDVNGCVRDSITISDSHKAPKVENSSLIRQQTSNVGRQKSEDDMDHMQEVADDLVAKLMDDEEGQEKLTSSSTEKWYYRDPQGEVQGPFSSGEMAEWFRAGYFALNLLVKRSCDDRYSQLGDLIKIWGRIPFMAGPTFPPLKGGDPVSTSPPTTGQPTMTPGVNTPHPRLEQENFLMQQYQQYQIFQRQLLLRQQAVAGKLSQNEQWSTLSPVEQQQLIMQQIFSQPVTQQPVDACINPFMQQMAAQTHKNPVMHLLNQLHQPKVPTTSVPDSPQSPTQTQTPVLDPLQQLIQQMGGLQQPSTNAPTLPSHHSLLHPQSLSMPDSVTNKAETDSNPIQQLMRQLGSKSNKPQMESVWGGNMTTGPTTAATMAAAAAAAFTAQGWLGQMPAAPPGQLPFSFWDLHGKDVKTEQQILEEQMRSEEERRREELRKQEEAQRRSEEDEKKRKQLEEELRKKEAEKKRLEEQMLKLEEERKKEERRRKEEERKRLEEKQRLEEKLRLEEEQKQKLAEEAAERKRQQEEAKRLEEEAAARKREEAARKKEEERKRKEEEKERKRKLEEERKREEEERQRQEEEAARKKQQQEEEERRLDQQRRQTEALRRLQEQQQRTKAAPWSQQTPGTGSSLADIQRQEKEKKERELREQQQQQLLLQLQQQQLHQQNQGSESANNGNSGRNNSLQLKWAERKSVQANAVKSLAEIQAEEQERLAKQHEKERAERVQQQKEVVLPPTAGIWGTASQSLSWTSSGSNATTVWGSTTTASAGVAGFWDEVAPAPAKPAGKTAAAGKSKSNSTASFPASNTAAKPSGSKTRSKKEEALVMKLFEQNVPRGDEFTQWCNKALSGLQSSVDIPTFVGFLRDIESPFEVKEYVRVYLGEGKDVQEFAKQFLERRSKWRSAQKAAPQEDDMCAPAPAVNPLNTDFQEVKAKGRKAKKNKMFRVDNRILGFNVTAAQDRINVGDRDYGEM